MMASSARHGFTLIELIAATALSAVLMIALLHITTTTRRASANFERVQTPAWIDQFVQLVGDDLSAATGFEAAPGSIVIWTTAAHDAITLDRRQIPVRVTYQLNTTSLRPGTVDTTRMPNTPGLTPGCLVRIEQDLTRPKSKPIRHAVALGVMEFAIAPVVEAEDEQDPQAPASAVAMDVMIRLADRPGQTIRRRIVYR